MILLPSETTVIVTPPRCASYALERYFCDSGFGKRHDSKDRHWPIPPPQCQDWRKIIVVRNPYRRMESLWRLHSTHSRGGYWSFFDRCAEQNQCEYHDALGSDAIVVHVETLSSDLLNLGLPHEVPIFHASLAARQMIEPSDAIRDWAHPDCERYGYPTDPTSKRSRSDANKPTETHRTS